MLPERVRFPELVKELEPLKKLMLPVFVSPMVRVCLLVVAITPVLLRVRFPEMEAVGVPEPTTLMKANLAEFVEVEPRRRSSVM